MTIRLRKRIYPIHNATQGIHNITRYYGQPMMAVQQPGQAIENMLAA